MSITVGFASEILKNVKFDDGRPKASDWTHHFNLVKPMPMKLENFIEHFLYQLNLDEELLVHAFGIVESALEELTSLNVHRIVLTALAISYKFCIDCPATNSQIEKVGGLKPGELLTLETVLLDVCQWKIHQLDYTERKNSLIKIGEEELTCRKEVHDEDNEDNEDYEDLVNLDDSDTTGCETNESFSELSAFFTF
ncbi:hypothetical protein SteCoe_8715 [Stentor coeruleus]|uniref:Cyclin-like domain-containing protein n=1 Tax=Stentor coeruleus TaxID=5963 RepID=A0A1R2CJJ0_9CILI|nr:hypothetical protein SteCoe_8715 [Stentor coeruleus]